MPRSKKRDAVSTLRKTVIAKQHLAASVDFNDDTESENSKQLRMLVFRNPGKFMEDFDPERSSREMRKVNRRIYKESARKNQYYDDAGLLFEDSRDICDCLEEDCPGCHLPCPKCHSPKCGPDCRCHRRWYYQEVEVEGANCRVPFPGPPPRPT